VETWLIGTAEAGLAVDGAAGLAGAVGVALAEVELLLAVGDGDVLGA
jgi:hypothetical protein